MPTNLRKRRTQNNNIRNDAGQRIDGKSKQLLFFDCEVDTVKRKTLKSHEQFSQEGAKQVFDKYNRKRQAKCRLYCLIDRLRLEKRNTLGSGPFRKHLTYREIKRFFVFPENPRIFMLCVVDEFGKRSYEMYRCKPEDVNTICDLTYGASTDPQNIIRDTEPIRQMSVSSSHYETSPSLLDRHSIEERAYTAEPVTLPRASTYQMNCVSNGHDFDRNSPIVRSSYMDSIKSPDIFFQTNSEHDQSNIPRLTPPARVPVGDAQSRATVTAAFSFYELRGPEKHEEFVLQNDGYQKTHPLRQIKAATSEMVVSQPYNYTNANHNQPIVRVFPSQPNYRPKESNAPHQYGIWRPKGNIIIEREFTNDGLLRNRKSRSTFDVRWGDEVTYVGYNPRTGVSVTRDGPVYMYINRYQSQQDLARLRPTSPLKTQVFRLSTNTERSESNLSNDT